MGRPIVMPSFGMYTAEGTLTAWKKPSGDWVEAGETVLEIETEKAVQEVQAPVSGVLHHVLDPGARLQVESLIGYVLERGEEPLFRLRLRALAINSFVSDDEPDGPTT